MPLSYTYSVILEPAEEGGFLVHVPALPEICTEGETEEEALAMAKDAIELVIESRGTRRSYVPTDGFIPCYEQTGTTGNAKGVTGPISLICRSSYFSRHQEERACWQLQEQWPGMAA